MRTDSHQEGLAIVQIFVRDNNVDQALKALKKKMQREGIYREMKMRKHYEKPSERRVREAGEAVRRGASRLQWNVLDWNAPAIAFYEAQGARLLQDWRICRLDGSALAAMGAAT